MRFIVAIALVASLAVAPAMAQTPVPNPIQDITPGQSTPATTQQQGPVRNPVQDITPGQSRPVGEAQQPPQAPATPTTADKPQPERRTQPPVLNTDIWRAGAQVNVQSDNHYDVWAAGALTNVRGEIANELHAAGADVDVSTTTGGDAYVAGAIVSVTGNYARDLYAAGARVSIAARVDGELKAGGARVLVRPQADVRGLTQIAGADVVFAGVSRGRTEIYGDTVQIDGSIGGDLVVRARSVTIGKSAVIDGTATFQTFNEPTIVEGAVIRGRQTTTLPAARASRFSPAQALFSLVLFSIAAGFMAGLGLLVIRRAFVQRGVAALRNRPGHSFGLGVLIFILVPAIALVLMATIIGIPTGLLILFALPLLWLAATVITAFTMGDFLVNRVPRARGFFAQLWQLIVGLVVLSVIGIIPVLGFLTWLGALLVGLGAFWQGLWTPTTAPAVAEEPVEATEETAN
jgi:hypothetical protein